MLFIYYEEADQDIGRSEMEKSLHLVLPGILEIRDKTAFEIFKTKCMIHEF